jgi:hypothetical protein
MYCPNCGTEAPVAQKFCRSCGFSLEKVPQLLAEQLPGTEARPSGRAQLQHSEPSLTVGLLTRVPRLSQSYVV